jgi:hypothetical protein
MPFFAAKCLLLNIYLATLLFLPRLRTFVSIFGIGQCSSRTGLDEEGDSLLSPIINVQNQDRIMWTVLSHYRKRSL